jgi:glutathione synthase
MLINSIETEFPLYTTTLLSKKLQEQGHVVYYISVRDLIYYENGEIGGYAVQPEQKKFKTLENFYESLKKNKSNGKWISSSDIDIIFLRNDPSGEDEQQSWAQSAGISFGNAAVQQDIIVLNDPAVLARAINKTYYLGFPQEVRPNTLVTRNLDKIKTFFQENKENIVLKPLMGSGGKNIFQVTKDNIKNLNQIVDAIRRDGFLVAQEYIPEAEDGDLRVFLLNGEILQREGKYAVLRRKNAEGDFRSNMHVGGTPVKGKITEEIHEIINKIRPKLIADGLFFTGIDVVGDKLLEVNLMSPGGLNSAGKLAETDFTAPIIKSLENKVMMKKLYGHVLSNTEIATM